MNRLRFLQLAIAALFAPKVAAAADVDIDLCAGPAEEIKRLQRRLRRLRRRVRQRLVQASEEDNCGAPNEYADGYRQCGRDLVAWFDAGMPREVR